MSYQNYLHFAHYFQLKNLYKHQQNIFNVNNYVVITIGNLPGSTNYFHF